MKKLLSLILLCITLSQVDAQLFTFQASDAGDQYLLYYRNDTVILEPMFLGAGATVSISCNPAIYGICYLLADTEQECIDYIVDNSLKMSEHSTAQAEGVWHDMGGGVRIINLASTTITVTFKDAPVSSISILPGDAMSAAYNNLTTPYDAEITM
jgi:hypothetical protein